MSVSSLLDRKFDKEFGESIALLEHVKIMGFSGVGLACGFKPYVLSTEGSASELKYARFREAMGKAMIARGLDPCDHHDVIHESGKLMGNRAAVEFYFDAGQKEKLEAFAAELNAGIARHADATFRLRQR